MKKTISLLSATLCAVSFTSLAASYDGSKVMICAPIDTITCAVGKACSRGEAEDVNLDRFLEVDVANKTVTGIDTDRSTPIQNVNMDGEQLVLQGSQNGRAWSATISQKTGELTVGIAGHNEAFTVFGACMVR
ncbi:MAG: hypothetical protein ACU84Q_16130 [Gammaproteobacteria bacterium]